MPVAALVTLAILALSTSADARTYPTPPPNPPEALYVKAWRRAADLPPSDALCRHRMPKRLMKALHNRCLWLTAGMTAQNCNVDDTCARTLEELKAWCGKGDRREIPCSDASLSGAQ